MSWFIILLFWNPVIQDYELPSNWVASPMTSHARCDHRLQYIEQYLPSTSPDDEFLVGCVQANSLEAAVAILKETK